MNQFDKINHSAKKNNSLKVLLRDFDRIVELWNNKIASQGEGNPLEILCYQTFVVQSNQRQNANKVKKKEIENENRFLSESFI